MKNKTIPPYMDYDIKPVVMTEKEIKEKTREELLAELEGLLQTMLILEHDEIKIRFTQNQLEFLIGSLRED